MKKQQYNPEIHHRRSIRLKGHDYAGGGLYFVTMCSKNRRQLFGELKNGKMRLSGAGRIAKECWQAIPEHFPQVVPGVLAVMPDHIHGLIKMPAGAAAGATAGAKARAKVRAKNFSPLHPPKHSSSPQPARPPAPKRPCGTSRTLGSVVRGFKVGVTKWVRKNTDIHDVWHRNYYEMIVRTPEAEKKIAEYIRMNPWKLVQHAAYEGRTFRMIGNPALLNREKIALLCSRNAPPDILDAAMRRVRRAGANCCFVGGFHSPPEKSLLDALLASEARLVCCPAWGIDTLRIPAAWLPALEDNRMLILEMCNRDGNLAAAEDRNRFVLQHADKLYLPHISPGGMLDRLVRATFMSP